MKVFYSFAATDASSHKAQCLVDITHGVSTHTACTRCHPTSITCPTLSHGVSFRL